MLNILRRLASSPYSTLPFPASDYEDLVALHADDLVVIHWRHRNHLGGPATNVVYAAIAPSGLAVLRRTDGAGLRGPRPGDGDQAAVDAN